jgi:hypothetical protein
MTGTCFLQGYIYDFVVHLPRWTWINVYHGLFRTGHEWRHASGRGMRECACQDTARNVGDFWVHCNLKRRRELVQADRERS